MRINRNSFLGSLKLIRGAFYAIFKQLSIKAHDSAYFWFDANPTTQVFSVGNQTTYLNFNSSSSTFLITQLSTFTVTNQISKSLLFDASGNLTVDGHIKSQGDGSGGAGHAILKQGNMPGNSSGSTLIYAIANGFSAIDGNSSTDVATFSWANTANRTYTLPNVSGNIPLEDGTVTTANINKSLVVKSDKTIGIATELINSLNPPKWAFLNGANSVAYTSGSSSATVANMFGIGTTGATSAGGYAVRSWDVNSLGGGFNSIGSTAYILNWGKVIALYSRVCIISTTNDTGSIFQISFGRYFSDYTSISLVNKGFALRWNPGSVAQLVTYNTTEAAINTSFTPTANQAFDLLIVSNNGTVYCYINGSLVATATTQTPTGNSVTYASTAQMGIYNAGSITNKVQSLASLTRIYSE